MFADELQLDRPHYAVAIYDVMQSYGGPEEGGWWYHEGTLLGVAEWFRDEDAAYEYARSVNANLEVNWNSYREGHHAQVVEVPRREYPYELCHSDAEVDVRDMVQRWDIPTYWPEHRPHYC